MFIYDFDQRVPALICGYEFVLNLNLIRFYPVNPVKFCFRFTYSHYEEICHKKISS